MRPKVNGGTSSPFLFSPGQLLAFSLLGTRCDCGKIRTENNFGEPAAFSHSAREPRPCFRCRHYEERVNAPERVTDEVAWNQQLYSVTDHESVPLSTLREALATPPEVRAAPRYFEHTPFLSGVIAASEWGSELGSLML